MSTKICVSKKFFTLVLFIALLAVGTVYFSNLLVKKTTTLKTRAEEVKKENLIINGVLAEDNEYPYFARISSKLGTCGGALIGPEWVITAGHCVKVQNLKDTFVIIGLNHVDSKLYAQFSSGITEIFDKETGNEFPSLFDYYIESNDIALLHLEKPAIGVPYISIPDPSKDRNADGVVDLNDYPEMKFDGYDGTIIGFGITEDGKISKDLLKGTMTTKNYIGRSPDKVNLETKTTRGCAGDSGGPYIMNIDYRPQLVGIYSRTDRFCSFMNLYTSVTYYAKWINAITKIDYETGTTHLPPSPFLQPIQTSQTSLLCKKSISLDECDSIGGFCAWYGCQKCAPKGTLDEEVCK